MDIGFGGGSRRWRERCHGRSRKHTAHASGISSLLDVPQPVPFDRSPTLVIATRIRTRGHKQRRYGDTDR